MRRSVVAAALGIAAALVLGLPAHAAAPRAISENLNNIQNFDATALEAATQRDTFAGFTVDRENQKFIVHATSSTPPALLSSVLVLPVPAGWSITSDQVENSWDELQALMDNVTNKTAGEFSRISTPVLTGWWIDTNKNSLSLQLSSLDPDVMSAARSEFGAGRVTFTTGEKGIAAAQGRLTESSSPFHAGARIFYPGPARHCTAGFKILKGGDDYMLTAGHCGTGYGKSSVVTNLNSVPIGATVSRTLEDNGLDTEYYSGSFSAYAWVGGVNSETGNRVSGSLTPTYGNSYCVDGSFTGEACNAAYYSTSNECHVIAYSQIGSVDRNICSLRALQGTDICQRGDSGGPIINDTSSTVQAIGTLVAITSGGSCYYHPISTLLSHWGASLATS